jgi:hypothetical protein
MAIELKTEIPGPRSREIVARRCAATPPGAAKLMAAPYLREEPRINVGRG